MSKKEERWKYITIPPKPQQPVEETYGLARTAGFGSIVTLDFLQELSAQLTCSGRMERQLHRVRQDLIWTLLDRSFAHGLKYFSIG